jgi:hypothetical protein
MSQDRTRIAFRLLRPDLEVRLTPLYAPDDVIAELVLGDRAKLWTSELVRQLEREGMPPTRRLFGSGRYVPAVFQFFGRREGLRQGRDFEPEDGPENFNNM